MNVTFSPPEKPLAPYIALIWTFKSGGGLPTDDTRLIVPDGRAKILIPYKNGMRAIVDGRLLNTNEQKIYLAGIQSRPVTIDSTDTDTGTIGIELTAKGLYRFFKLRMGEIADQLISFDDLFERWGAQLEQRTGDLENPEDKIALLQRHLLQILHSNSKDYSLLDYAIDSILSSNGMITIQTLQDRTGYSKRYLDIIFKQHVGYSPKAYAGIIRFQTSYQLWSQQKEAVFSLSGLQEYYYDQSHFIKDFKRFTGFSPRQYLAAPNDFGRAFRTEK